MGCADVIAPTIQRFVANGGSLYASDWAGAVVEVAFPGVLSFDQNGTTGDVNCTVRDPGLSEIIGRQIKVHFDLPGWWRVRKISESVRVFVERSAGLRSSSPVVLTFPHGCGHVVYTSFHNEAQVSESEKRLLRFLVLRPILSKTVAAANAAAVAKFCKPDKEIVTTISPDKPSAQFPRQSTGFDQMVFLLHWVGYGRLRLLVCDPNGRTVKRLEGDQSPLVTEVQSNIPGKWTCQVEAVTASNKNIPFVLTMASNNDRHQVRRDGEVSRQSLDGRTALSTKSKVAIVLARCCQSKAEFGIRFEQLTSLWIADWAFLLKPGTAKREGYEKTRLDGQFQFANNYPGCPKCKSGSIFLCTCGNVGCWNGQTKAVTCPWCSQRVTLECPIESLPAGQDR